MFIASPIDSASSWLKGSNVLYVCGAVLTLAAAAHVLVEKRAVLAGKRSKESFWAEASVVLAALVSVLGTIGAIHFSNVVSHLKDVALLEYQQKAGIEIAQANADAVTAKAVAEETSNANLLLQKQLTKHEGQELGNEAKLATQNKETFDYAHALAQQQATMAEQARVSPVLDAAQIVALATLLRPFAGQDVILHSTPDTTVLRLKVSIAQALMGAGITFKQNSMDMGQVYQGVSVAVRSPQAVPPLANSLVAGLRAAGIVVSTVSLNAIPAGSVAIYLGPN